MLNVLLQAHSAVRYMVLLAGVATLGYALFLVTSKRPYDKGMRATAASFAGSIHLQVLLGFVLIVSGRFYAQLIGHLFMMFAAAVVAQVPLSVMRRRPPEARTPMPHVVSAAVALLFIWAGVMAIGRGLLDHTFF